MRVFAGTCVLLSLVSLVSCQRGFNFGSSNFPGNQAFGNRNPNAGLVSLQSLPPSSGPRGCFCLPANNLCNPGGVIPKTATRISEINTRIVNTSPGRKCPQDQRQCCFGSLVVDGQNPKPGSQPLAGCGTRQGIAPGRDGTADADFGEYPWMALIVDDKDNFIGAGALVDPFWVLTAAHRLTKSGSLKVRLGDYDIGIPNEFQGFEHVEVPVAQVIFHKDFNPDNLFNDVALLRLSHPVPLGPHINTVCLPERFQTFVGQRCYVSGWGQNVDGKFQRIMKEVDVPIVNDGVCEGRLRANTRLGQGFTLNRDSFICAGGEIGKDACTGDGGAPLVCEESEGVFTIVGMVAWGIGCGETDVPGVYVDVAQFSNYIQSNIFGRQ